MLPCHGNSFYSFIMLDLNVMFAHCRIVGWGQHVTALDSFFCLIIYFFCLFLFLSFSVVNYLQLVHSADMNISLFFLCAHTPVSVWGLVSYLFLYFLCYCLVQCLPFFLLFLYSFSIPSQFVLYYWQDFYFYICIAADNQWNGFSMQASVIIVFWFERIAH